MVSTIRDLNLSLVRVEDVTDIIILPVYLQLAGNWAYFLFVAHKHYRDDPRVEVGKLFETSRARFLRMFSQYQEQQTNLAAPLDGGEGIVLDELRALIRTTDNNIALVLYQAYFGRTFWWNAMRMVKGAREAPVEWVQFVAAEDNDVFLG